MNIIVMEFGDEVDGTRELKGLYNCSSWETR